MKCVDKSKFVDEVRKLSKSGQSEEIVILSDGKPVGFYHNFEDDDEAWEYQLLRDPRFIRSVEKARKDFREGRFYTSEQVDEMLRKVEAAEKQSASKNAVAEEPAQYGVRSKSRKR